MRRPSRSPAADRTAPTRSPIARLLVVGALACGLASGAAARQAVAQSDSARAPSPASSPTPSPAPATVPPASPRPAANASTIPGPGVLPGDALKLVIWREPDLSGEFTVDETGTVTLPKVGAMRVAGEGAGAVKARVVAAFQPYLTHSAIEVTVLRRVQVTGAVRTPGVYRVDPTMTLGDALALAGGATTDGSPDQVELLREGERVGNRLNYRTQIGEAEVRSGDQLYVPERGWSARRIELLSAGVGLAALLLIAANRR